jgi:histidinol dehydrogenase
LLQRAADNIRAFGNAVMKSLQPVSLQRDGVTVGMDWRPVERAACYVPGGRYPLPSTALMTAITAQVAGVSEIVLVSPDLRDETIYAGTLAGVETFYCLGGAQAIAAMAYGTASIQPVDMVAGPGNTYVAEAKRQLQGVIGIDMLAGPSEVAIIADSGANPQWVALDLLAQAEHDPNARAYLLTDSKDLAKQVLDALKRILFEKADLPDYLRQSDTWGRILVFPKLEDCVEASNRLAPEHLELLTANADTLKPLLKHYGAVFVGYGTSVPVGDYMAGPNHTLPTNHSARFSGGLTPLTFLRGQSWIHVNGNAKQLLEDTTHFARLEGLTAHALSSEARV